MPPIFSFFGYQSDDPLDDAPRGVRFRWTATTSGDSGRCWTGFSLTMNSLRLTTAHPQGGNGMYGDSSSMRGLRVVDGEYRVDGFENVFVADASLFPSTITVNPQWTIMAMSSLAAKIVLAKTL